jgi:broad specificity phosphatase PhoE
VRVVLIRHGRSAYSNGKEWVDASALKRLQDAYDAAGLAVDDAPPPALAAQVADAEFLVASDLTRAIESAERLADGRPVLHSPLLREMPLEAPTWLPPVRWPVGVWNACGHLQWGYRILRGTEAPPQERRRAAAAAKWIARLATEGSPVIAVTHGVFRRLLAGQLLTTGWEPDGPHRSYGHWSAWAFRAKAGRTGNGR